MRKLLLLVLGTLGVLGTTALAQSSIQVKTELPFFFYQGDQPKLQFVLHNTSLQEKTGNLQLELFDAAKKQPVDGWFYNQLANQYFTLGAGERTVVRFPVTIPHIFTGSVDWQLTVRIDSTQQLLRGNFHVRNAEQPEAGGQDYTNTMKGNIWLISVQKKQRSQRSRPPSLPLAYNRSASRLYFVLPLSLTKKQIAAGCCFLFRPGYNQVAAAYLSKKESQYLSYKNPSRTLPSA